MKIGLDLRTINTSSTYFKFVYDFVIQLKQEDKENTYILYTSALNYYNFIELTQFFEVKKLDINAGSLMDQTAGLKFFKDENLDNLIFFSYIRPYLYKKRNFIIIEDLKDLLYPKDTSSIKKLRYNLELKLSVLNSEKIIWFSKDTKIALNEKLNIREEKIEIINPFFVKNRKNTDFIDIRMKYNIVNDYVIYPGLFNNQNKNITRLIEAIARLNEENINIDLVFTDKSIANIVELREIILRYKIENKVKFLSDIKDEDLYFYYFESAWIVYPSLYESFPFELNDAIYFSKNIVLSNIENLKNIFSDKVTYFHPMSINEIKNEILKLKDNKNIPDYSGILEKYSVENFTKSFIHSI
jgi:glycosyltransferase involved in cell wall biosynthesis